MVTANNGVKNHSTYRGVVMKKDVRIDLWDEIEGHPALLELLATVAREAGYNVEYNLRWGFRWVDVKCEASNHLREISLDRAA